MIVPITIYLLSTILMWKYINVAYNKGGIWENEDYLNIFPSLFWVFTPIVNTFGVIYGWVWVYPKNNPTQPRTQHFFRKFFNIKKKKA